MDHHVKAESVTPIMLLRSFEEASDQGPCPTIQYNAGKQFGSPILLPGEIFVLHQDNVTCVGTLSHLATGMLFLTNYRLIFKGKFCHDSSMEGSSKKIDQDELARRGYKYKKKRYQLPKVNRGIKRIGESVRKKGKSIQASFRRKRGNNLCKQYHLDGEDGFADTESQETNVNLLRMRLGTHLTLQKVDSIDSETEDGVVADLENVSISLPIVSIHDVKKFPKQYLDKEKLLMLRDGIEITCNNLISVKFCIGGSETYDAEELLQILEKHCNPKGSAMEFAYIYAANLKIPSSCRSIVVDRTPSNFYEFEDEVRRLKLDQGHHFVTVEQNCCPRYPKRVIVPSCVGEKSELRKLAEYHCNNCFPIVTWRSSRSGGYLLRSSLPRTARGLSDQRCEVDEKFISELGHLTSNREAKVWIFTERCKFPPPSTATNQSGLTVAEGEAYYYPHCSFVNDDNLPDVQAVQQNGLRLMNAISSKIDDGKYLSQLEDSGWLENIRRLLEISTAVASEIENEKSTVVVAYDEGIDRTSQVASLVQMLLDPFYRTLDGFQVLIQKEWLSVRHPFIARNSSTGIVDDDLSPIFLQFLDCVWQVCQQFPTLFQFNENLLETMATHSYSGRFGTFLDFKNQKSGGLKSNHAYLLDMFMVKNKEKANKEMHFYNDELVERDMIKSDIAGDNPISFWTWLNVVGMARDDFINSNYDEGENTGPIYPVVAAPWLQIWTWHYRYKTEENLVLAEHVAYMQMEKLQREYKDRLEEYQSLLEQLSELDAVSASQYAFHTRSGGSIIHKRSDSCATNYHLENNEEPKPKNLFSSFFTKKAKSYDNLQSIGGKEKVGKSTFYDGDSEAQEKMKVGTFPRSGMIRSPTNLRKVLNDKGIKFLGVSEVKITEKTCSGYLLKQGQIRKSWHRRWFVLDVRKGCVAYFENHVSDQPKGVFKCMLITQVYPNINQEKYPNLFYIDTIGRRYSVEAPNINAMKVWLGCFTSLS